MRTKEQKAYRQINVILHNANLTANSDRKRTQKFLAFSDMEAIQIRHDLAKSDQWGKDSWVSFEDAQTKQPVTL